VGKTVLPLLGKSIPPLTRRCGAVIRCLQGSSQAGPAGDDGAHEESMTETGLGFPEWGWRGTGRRAIWGGQI